MESNTPRKSLFKKLGCCTLFTFVFLFLYVTTYSACHCVCGHNMFWASLTGKDPHREFMKQTIRRTVDRDWIDNGILPTGSEVHVEPLMNTQVSLRYYLPENINPKTAEAIIAEAFSQGKQYAQALSFYDAESELSTLNRAPAHTPHPVTPQLGSLLDQAFTLAHETKGAFSPTLGAATRLWKKAKSSGTLPTPEALDKVKKIIDYTQATYSPQNQTYTKSTEGLLLDLGGIGKGAVLDHIAHILREKGITTYLLSSTSDILVGDPPPGLKTWPLYVTDKKIPLPLKNAALSTSGNTHQHSLVDGQTLGHLIDNHTAKPTEDLTEYCVQAPTATLADALATAAHFLTPKQKSTLESSLNVKFITAPLPPSDSSTNSQ